MTTEATFLTSIEAPDGRTIRVRVHVRGSPGGWLGWWWKLVGADVDETAPGIRLGWIEGALDEDAVIAALDTAAAQEAAALSALRRPREIASGGGAGMSGHTPRPFFPLGFDLETPP